MKSVLFVVLGGIDAFMAAPSDVMSSGAANAFDDDADCDKYARDQDAEASAVDKVARGKIAKVRRDLASMRDEQVSMREEHETGVLQTP